MGIDQNFIIVEDQRRQIGEDQNRKEIGRQQLIELIFGKPRHDDIECQKTPKHRRQPDEHRPVARQIQREPVDQIEVGNRQEQKEQVADEKASATIAARHPNEKIDEKNDTDGELYPQAGLREMPVVPCENFHGHSQQQDDAGRQHDEIQ